MLLIPRVFHRIWLGGRPMPAEFEAFGATWLRLHPGWEMKLWTEANLPPMVNRWAFKNAQTLAGRSDVLRYEILFRFGGIYVDTDFECRRNLERLVDNVECFAGQYGDGTFEHGRFAAVNNAIIGGVAGHPFLRDLVEEVEANVRSLSLDTPSCAYLTGPVFLTCLLQRHPEVKLFPARFFYPYGSRERWRRYERFPRAYAVHHWTHSHLPQLRPAGRRFATGRRFCLSLVLHPTGPGDALRIQWVLEGLCAQTVSDFEVIAVVPPGSPVLRTWFRRYQPRLRLRIVSGRHVTEKNRSAAHRNLALRHAGASRILFLDLDCLPDTDVVARHAVHADRDVLVYGYRRIYPREKLFPLRDAIDYGGVVHASVRESSPVYIAPSALRWRDVLSGCFSAPTAAVRAAGGFNASRSGNEVRDLARRLAIAGCPTLPCLYGSTITWLGPKRRRRKNGARPANNWHRPDKLE